MDNDLFDLADVEGVLAVSHAVEQRPGLEELIAEGLPEDLPYILNDMQEDQWGRLVLSRFDNGTYKFTNLSLHTKNVFIGDIDFTEEITEELALSTIKLTENTFNYNFRVYKTTKGLRIFNTQVRMPYKKNHMPYEKNHGVNIPNSHELFNSLKCDKNYVRVCEFREEYAARLTPKTNRPNENQICTLVKTGAKITDKEILFVVKLHDYFCLNNMTWCNEWRC